MLYIVCEDNTSGFEFWEKVNEHILDNKACIVIADCNKGNTAGIDNIAPTVQSLPLADNDVVLLAIDLIDAAASNQISRSRAITTAHNAELLVTGYLFFEEMFLNFSKLYDWTQLELPKDLIRIAEQIKLNIRDKNWLHYVSSSVERDTVTKLHTETFGGCGNLSTAPRLCKALMRLLTNRALPNKYRNTRNPNFDVAKGTLGECWLYSCPTQEQKCLKSACKLDPSSNYLSACEKLTLVLTEFAARYGTISVPLLKQYLQNQSQGLDKYGNPVLPEL